MGIIKAVMVKIEMTIALIIRRIQPTKNKVSLFSLGK